MLEVATAFSKRNMGIVKELLVNILGQSMGNFFYNLFPISMGILVFALILATITAIYFASKGRTFKTIFFISSLVGVSVVLFLKWI